MRWLALMLLCAALLACNRGERRAAPAVGLQPPAALYERMTAFTRALRESDTTAFLAAFSQTRPWIVYGTHDAIPVQHSMRYADLVRAIDTKDRTHARLFGESPTSLRAFTTTDQPWTALSAIKFAPPPIKRGVAWVAWRQEDASWVVDAIAWPIQ